MRRALWLFVGLAFGACGLPSADEYARGGAPADGGTSSSSSAGGPNDAGATPGPEAGSAETGGDAGGANLVSNPDFEDGTCGNPNFFLAMGGVTSDAHTGKYACQTCRQDENIEFYTYNPFFVVRKPVVGATYHARAWVKRGAESFKDQQVTISVRAANTEPTFEEVQVVTSPGVALGDGWQLVETALTLTKDAQEIDLFVGANTLATAGQRCFIVDDVALWRE